MKRGLHNIKNEMIFRSNQGFIFHDSRGFEAGGASELDDVKLFIKQRAKEKKLPNQIHAIWLVVHVIVIPFPNISLRYCIPMDSPRPFTKAEEDFFSKVGTGKGKEIVYLILLLCLNYTGYSASHRSVYQV